MRYKKITVTFNEEPTRLNRTLLVREDLDLFTLGVCILTTLKATYEHFFLFKDNVYIYNPEAFDDVCFVNDVFMTNYHFNDLQLDENNSFTLIYDTGDGWEFNVKVDKKIEEIQSRKLVFLLSGKGQGIFEDNISSLYDYLDGKVPPETTNEMEDQGIYLPWNLSLKCFKDFDKKINVNKINKTLNEDVIADLLSLEENYYF